MADSGPPPQWDANLDCSCPLAGPASQNIPSGGQVTFGKFAAVPLPAGRRYLLLAQATCADDRANTRSCNRTCRAASNRRRLSIWWLTTTTLDCGVRSPIAPRASRRRITAIYVGHSAFAWPSTVSNVGQTMRLLGSVSWRSARQRAAARCRLPIEVRHVVDAKALAVLCETLGKPKQRRIESRRAPATGLRSIVSAPRRLAVVTIAPPWICVGNSEAIWSSTPVRSEHNRSFPRDRWHEGSVPLWHRKTTGSSALSPCAVNPGESR